jgi:hypothetical protein
LLLADAKVLLALARPLRQLHALATSRLSRRGTRWATCALTQLGFIRLSANPSVVGQRKSPAEAAALLDEMTRDSEHVYLSESPSPVGLGWLRESSKLLGHQQVTDLYLLLFAAHHAATLLTFDRRLTLVNERLPVQLLAMV